MFDLRSIKVIVFGALAMLLAFTMPSFSSATFTESSTSTASVTSGTWDKTPPKISLLYAPTLQVSGTQSVTAQASDPLGSGVKRVDIQIRRVGTSSWKPCSTHLNENPVAAEKDYTCTWRTEDWANDSFELQATATDAKGHTTESQIVTTNVANGILTLVHPGLTVTGQLQLTARSTRLAYMTIWYATENTNTWQRACISSILPAWQLNCSTDLPSGTYNLRLTGTGILVSGEHIIRNVKVHNPGGRAFNTDSVARTSMEPATINSEAVAQQQTDLSDEAPAEDVSQQTAPAETSPVEPTPVEPAPEDELEDEADIEPAPEEPAVPGDDEDEATDEAPVAETPLRGVGIDATDGGAGVGVVNEGDSFTFTYSGEVDLTTVLPGWAGEATAVSVRLRDGQLLGRGAQDDTLDIRSGELPVELGHVHLGADVIDIDQQMLLPATMTAATVTVDGALLSTVTVTLGSVVDEDEMLLPATTTPALTWTPSAAVTTVTGRACVVEPVTQSAGGSF